MFKRADDDAKALVGSQRYWMIKLIFYTVAWSCIFMVEGATVLVEG